MDHDQLRRRAGSDHVLWYFADPMCSWCWGFAPVIRAIVETYRGELAVSLVVGGLRAGASAPLSSQEREAILDHWREVNRLTGQPFSFRAALPEDFVYDTEPACRAVVTVPTLAREATFPFFESVQRAFYVDQRDVTRGDVLADIASEIGLDADAFSAAWRSKALQDRVGRHFAMTRRAGVRGFPTLMLHGPDGIKVLARGYTSAQALTAAIDGCLDKGDGEGVAR
jgi:putative protein-disulfide isomerase